MKHWCVVFVMILSCIDWFCYFTGQSQCSIAAVLRQRAGEFAELITYFFL